MTTYAEPPAVVTGQTMTAANWNTWVVDVAKAMWVYTTAGDMEYAAAANTRARLPIGGAGKQLGISAGLPAWVDGVPGIFTAAGDLVYGTGPDAAARLAKPTVDAILKNTNAGAPSWKTLTDFLPGTAAGDIDYYTASQVKGRIAKPSVTSVLFNNSTGVPWWVAQTNMHHFELTNSAYNNTSWDGDSHGVGTTTITANTFNAGIPSYANGILVSVSAKWAAASDGNVLGVAPVGGGLSCLVVRSHVANYFMDNMGIVPLSGNQFDVTIAGGSANVWITIWGYFYSPT